LQEIRNLDWLELLNKLSLYATSQLSREELLKLKPLASEQEALNSFQEIGEALKLISDGTRPHMESLDLFSVWFSRIAKGGTLRPLELKDVRHFCLEVIALTQALKSAPNTKLKNYLKELFNADEPLSAIDQIITNSGDIRNDASETIFKLINEKSSLTKQLQNLLDKIVKDHKIEHILQERYVTTREGRWVLPIKSGLQHHFDGIIHASSQSRQTVFMEPEAALPINNRLRQVEVDIENEIERLLTELAKYLHTKTKAFEDAKKLLLHLDQLFAKAQLAQKLKAAPCEFNHDELLLIELRHPLLALIKPEVVSNDVCLEKDKRIIILSGPNAGGKTVLLKAVGLAAQMARCGLWPACGEGSHLPFFKNIFTAVGDDQSVDKSLSTFAAHLKGLNQAAKAEGSDSLILIDEICGSTDPEEGAALARSFIERFSKNKVFGIVTSHLGALKSHWPEDMGVIHGSLEFDKNTGPTYSLLMGLPGQSLALLAARAAGVDSDIITRAMAHLSPEHQKYQHGLDEIEELKTGLRKLEAELKAQKKETKKAQEKYEAELKKIEHEKEKIINKTVQSAKQKVDELIEKAQVTEVFKKHLAAERLKDELPLVIKAASGLKSNAPPGPDSIAAFTKAFPPGSKVYIPTFGQDGIVQSKPNSKGEVIVLSRSMRMTIPWQELKPPEAPQNPTRELVKRSGSFQYSPMDEDRIVDLRGLTTESAIEQLEIQLDAAALHQEDRLKVIHGHGTDALKKAIRNYLSRSVYVNKWHSGSQESDSDGVTWVEIKDS
jgi:DNA mismatch repair protein MutS2